MRKCLQWAANDRVGFFLLPGYGMGDTISYSESDTDMDALLLDINGRLTISTLGYRYQNLSFELSNLKQSSPVFGDAVVSGKVATYVITYKIPYDRKTRGQS